MPELWQTYLSAFLVGLVGGVHCLGMCGGIVSSLSLGLSKEQKGSSLLSYQLAYNIGRISSYVLAGAIMGGIGMIVLQWMPLYVTQRVLYALAGLMMILLGLYISGWWMALNHVEQAGKHFWKLLEPIAKRLLPINTTLQAFKVGLVWGWIPCGLVYSMLIQAVSSGSAINGGAIMLAFALGTLPNLLMMGFLAGAAARMLHSRWFKQVAGVMIIGFGVWTLLKVF